MIKERDRRGDSRAKYLGMLGLERRAQQAPSLAEYLATRGYANGAPGGSCRFWRRKCTSTPAGWRATRSRRRSGYPFSSRFSSLRKRQSTPWAMSFFGVLLIMPVSCRRSA
jgi:hypothetical protein